MGVILLLLALEGCAALGSLVGPEFWGKVWRLLFGGLIGLVFAVVLHFPLMGGFGAGAVGAGASQATEPSHNTSVTNITNEKGGTINMKTSTGVKFLGLDSFWWGVILAYLVPFLLRNRQHLADLLKGRRTGQVLSTWAHMLWGRALPAVQKAEGQIAAEVTKL
jgi:hypothetical protein